MTLYAMPEDRELALAAAAAAEAAARQGRFWDMHELLFRRQKALGDDDLRGYAAQLGLVQEAGEHGLRAVVVRRQGRERGQHGGAEVPVDPDHVQGGCRVHAAMVPGWQVSPHHQDPVTAGLPRPDGGQQPQFPGALHGRGSVTDLELGVDAADVSVDGVRRDG